MTDLQLSAGSQVRILENGDGTLTLGPDAGSTDQSKDCTLSYEQFGAAIEHALLGAYYNGANTITITNKKKFSHDQTRSIRNCVEYMSGTEIVKQSATKIKIQVLLDKQRVKVIQLLQRMTLLVSLSTQELLADEHHHKEVELYEMEVDRLYHLTRRALTRAVQDPTVLASSEIDHKRAVPGLMRVVDELERISDLLFTISSKHAQGEQVITHAQLEEFKDAVRSLNKKVTVPDPDIPAPVTLSFSDPADHQIPARLSRAYESMEQEVLVLLAMDQAC